MIKLEYLEQKAEDLACEKEQYLQELVTIKAKLEMVENGIKLFNDLINDAEEELEKKGDSKNG